MRLSISLCIHFVHPTHSHKKLISEVNIFVQRISNLFSHFFFCDSVYPHTEWPTMKDHIPLIAIHFRHQRIPMLSAVIHHLEEQEYCDKCCRAIYGLYLQPVVNYHAIFVAFTTSYYVSPKLQFRAYDNLLNEHQRLSTRVYLVSIRRVTLVGCFGNNAHSNIIKPHCFLSDSRISCSSFSTSLTSRHFLRA